MGYFLTTSPETAVPPNSYASPKTHTPASPVKERGHRFYMPETGRWASRDPIGEFSWLVSFGKYWAVSFQLQFITKRNDPLYLFVYNAPVDRHDFLGLTPGGIKCGANCTMEVTGCSTFPAVLQSCCNAHEQHHIGQMSSSFCKKKNNCCPDAGKAPQVPGDFGGKPLWPDLECSAYDTEVTCLRGLSGLNPTDQTTVNSRIIQLLEIMNSHSCPQNP